MQFSGSLSLPVLPTDAPVQPVPLDRALRLVNHGPVVLVSGSHGGEVDVMAAAWNMPLDFRPPTLCVVLDKSSRTRELIDAAGGMLALSLPTAGQSGLALAVGSQSAREVPDKLAQCGVSLWQPAGAAVPMVQGCAAWLQCRVLQGELAERMRATHDLFVAEVSAAWADSRVFREGRWRFDELPPELQHLRTLHYVAGGQFYTTGAATAAPASSPAPATDAA